MISMTPTTLMTPSTRGFVTAYADPPWTYGDKLRMETTKRSSTDQYRTTMSVEAICALYDRHAHTLAGHRLADDGFLFLWTTNPMLPDGSAARVCGAWDFVPKQLA